MSRLFSWRRRHRGVATALVLAAAAGAVAAAPPPADDYTRPDAVHSVVPSPSGKRMALVMNKDGNSVLAVVDVPVTGPGRIVETVAGLDIRTVEWVNEDRLVYTAFERGWLVSPGGAQTRAVDHDGSSSRALIAWGSTQTQTGSLIVSKVLPHGWWLLRPVRDGSADVFVVRQNDMGDGERALYQLARLNTMTGSLRYFVGLPDGAVHWLFDAKGEPVIVQTVAGKRARMLMRQPADGRWAVLDERDAYPSPAFEPLELDGAGRLIVMTDRGSATHALHAYDIAERRLDPEPLVRLSRYDVAGLEFDERTREPVAATVIADRPMTIWFDRRLDDVQKAVDAALPGRFNSVGCGNCKSTTSFSVESVSDRQPGEFFVYDSALRKLTRLGARRPWLAESTQATRSFHWISARDGLALPVVVTHPVGSKPDDPLPAVVVVHGGPWVRGADRRWDAEPQFLASRGWRVIEPGFRGSLGYGNRHVAASFKQWGRAMQDDLADAVQWAVGEKLVDASRVCIYGGSYGGYAALMGPIRSPGTYRCAASFAGVTDIELMFTSNRSDLTLDSKRYSMAVLIGDPVADAAMLRGVSPLRRVAEIKVPVLLAQGGQDRRVPPAHADDFASAARRAGVAVERVNYGDEGHGFALHENHSDFLNRLDRFITRSLAAR